jgi:hypothetical protein
MMADLLQQASDWLEAKRTQFASHVVTYVRGERSVELPATIGKTTFEVDDGYGVLVRHESRDFLILTADLILDVQQEEPQRGDRIRETQNQHVFVYEVSAPDKTPCWRYSDAFRKTFRIHTKQIEQQGAI